MRSGLFWKLFLLQMLAAATLLGGALAVTRVYTVRHFSEVIEKREREMVHELAAEFAQAYAQTPDLVKAAETIPMLWRRLHMPPGRARFCDGPDCPQPAPGEEFRLGFSRSAPPPGEAIDEESFSAPPPDAGFEGPGPRTDVMFESHGRGGGEMGVVMAEEPADGGPPRVIHFRARGPMLPLQLLDADGQRVLGTPEPLGKDALREPVTVDGTIVAYLAQPPMRRPPELQEFSRQELRRHLIVTPVALGVAAVFALLVTALIVKPIRRLSAGTAALSRREFATRLREGRRDELGQLATDFNRMAAALEGYDARQRQWLADIAHELRTPLSVLRGELEAVIDGVRPAGADAMRSLRQEVGRLEALIGDLQLVSLAESGGLRLNRADTDVSALVEQAAARFRERLASRGFTLHLSVGAALTATVDAQRLEQALANLLENVLRHGTPGPVTVSAYREADKIVISVADAGPGVPPEALPKLFDRLYRVESARTRAAGGAGLGLSIVKSIVEAHGGTVDAHPVGAASAATGLEIAIRL